MKKKILKAALRLLNEEGSEAVTTNHIIEDLQISPGTLYYHYKNKEEIVRAIFENIVNEFEFTNLLQLEEFKIDDFLSYIRKIYQLYYSYRFFFMDIVMLLKRDVLLSSMYAENLKERQNGQISMFTMLISAKVIRPFNTEEELRVFLHNMWIVTDFWFSYLAASIQKITPQSIDDGVVHLLSFIRPYATKKIQEEIDRSLQHMNLKKDE